ncbi:hypothetical protein [Tardiphaga sp.]|jgi:hypothetical protein|uniref:hypothetical protein n=1 Tax=Tardiphaga sp. TaxID=1926292 RepID=UPI0037D9E0C3
MTDEQLGLRKMTFEGIAYDDDWLVIWRGLAVGRILKQSGIAYGKPSWFWTITYSGTVKPARGSGVATDLEDGKASFKAAWAELRSRLTDDEIERFRRQEEATEHRGQWPKRS